MFRRAFTESIPAQLLRTDMSTVDFHAHILPNADHGSGSLEESLTQLSIANRYGFDKIVATPHFYPHKHNLSSFLSMREQCVSTLKRGLTSSAPAIAVGAEVLLCLNLNRLENLSSLCIGSSNVIMLELPFNYFNEGYIDTVEAISNNGFNVLLAHADRYPKENIERLIELGVSLQVNVSSLCKLVKRKNLFKWIEDGRVVALGSDIHGTKERNYKDFVSVQKRYPDEFNQISAASLKLWSKFKLM